MKDFSSTPGQQELKLRIREFAQTEILPGAEERDQNPQLPVALVRRMGQLGFVGVITPREFGGGGGGCQEFCIVLEEVAAACAATSVALIPQYQSQYILHNFGTESQKEKYLTVLARGEKLAAFALTESTAGSDVKAIRTVARRSEKGFVLNGHKSYINNATLAEVILVLAHMEKGFGFFIIDRQCSGLSIGKEHKPSGLRAAIIADIIFQNCVLPEESLLVKEGEGLRLVLQTMDFSRAGSASISIGIARASLEEALAYAKKRKVFGSLVADLQAIQWMIADMATELEAAQLLRDQAAWLNDQGLHPAKETAMAKVFAAEMATRTAAKAMQVCGAYGCMIGAHFERHWRDAKMYEVAGGTSEIMRLTIIRRVLSQS